MEVERTVAPASASWVEAVARRATPILAVAAVGELVVAVRVLIVQHVLSRDLSQEIACVTIGLVAFGLWMTRADAVARARARLPPPDMPPALWFIVPVANLWKPYQAVRRIWDMGAERQAHADRGAWSVQTAWWVATLVTAVLFGASEGVRFTELAAWVVPLRAAAHAMAAATLGLAIAVVRGIDRVQVQR